MINGFIDLARYSDIIGGSFKKTVSGIGLFINAAKQSVIQNKALSVTLMEMGVSAQAASAMMAAATVGISLAIGAIIAFAPMIRKELFPTLDELKQKSDKVINTFTSNMQSITDSLNSINEIKEDFETLSKGVNELGENVSLSSDEYERYKSLVEQIVEINPHLVKGYDNERQAIINKNTALDDTIEKLQKEIELENQKLLINGQSLFDTASKETDDYEKQLEYIQQAKTLMETGEFPLVTNALKL